MTKAVLITGAAGGIGSALCRSFANAGYSVLATDLPGKLKEDPSCFPFDLKTLSESERARAEFLSNVTSRLNGSPLCAVINNAATQILGSTEEITPSLWQETLSVNLLAPFWITKLLLPQLEKTNGSVVNIASIHASLTKPKFVAYATSKAALIGLTKSMAVDLGSKIRINAISPAAIETNMLKEGFETHPHLMNNLNAAHPIGRIGKPEEVASLALYLASAEAGFITGAVFEIDGAISSRLHDPE